MSSPIRLAAGLSVPLIKLSIISRGESVLTFSLVVRKVSLSKRRTLQDIAISPNVRRLLIQVLEVFEAFQQTAYGIFLCANL